MIKQFTEEQLAELEQLYGLKRVGTIKVRDGYIKPGDMVWWRASGGPAYVNSTEGSHGTNIIEFPNFYQIAEPKRKTVYEDCTIMTNQQRADIVEAFKWAKAHLSHCHSGYGEEKSDFICNALVRDGGSVLPGSSAAKHIIMSRLDGHDTYENWAMRKVGMAAYTEDADLNQSRQCQAARHAWLDSLIEEFST